MYLTVLSNTAKLLTKGGLMVLSSTNYGITVCSSCSYFFLALITSSLCFIKE